MGRILNAYMITSSIVSKDAAYFQIMMVQSLYTICGEAIAARISKDNIVDLTLPRTIRNDVQVYHFQLLIVPQIITNILKEGDSLVEIITSWRSAVDEIRIILNYVWDESKRNSLEQLVHETIQFINANDMKITVRFAEIKKYIEDYYVERSQLDMQSVKTRYQTFNQILLIVKDWKNACVHSCQVSQCLLNELNITTPIN